MKNRVSAFCTLAIALVFFNFMATAQSNNDGILFKVENPEKYNTFQLVSMDKDLSTFANLIVLSGLIRQ